MILEKHIKEISKLLNKEKIYNCKLLQVSFDIACIKFHLFNNENFIAKFYINKKNEFNAIKSEAQNLKYLNNKLSFFPKLIKSNNDYLIIEYLDNNNNKPYKTNLDFLNSIIELHSIKNDKYGFKFNTQIAAVEQVNDFDKNWINFYATKRLNPIFEMANYKYNLGKLINEKINFLLKNLNNFIPNNPLPTLLHGDMWEGNILFKDNKFVGFIDPGSFFGHNEMEIAYLRWFNPQFIDSKFLNKYNDYVKIDKNYQSYEPVYQLYYSLCNVALWDKSYIKETERILIKLGI